MLLESRTIIHYWLPSPLGPSDTVNVVQVKDAEDGSKRLAENRLGIAPLQYMYRTVAGMCLVVVSSTS